MILRFNTVSWLHYYYVLVVMWSVLLDFRKLNDIYSLRKPAYCEIQGCQTVCVQVFIRYVTLLTLHYPATRLFLLFYVIILKRGQQSAKNDITWKNRVSPSFTKVDRCLSPVRQVSWVKCWWKSCSARVPESINSTCWWGLPRARTSVLAYANSLIIRYV